MTMPDYEKRVEVFRIIEWKDNSIYRTESEGLRWVPYEEEAPSGYIYASISSNSPEALEMNIRRKRHDD